MTQNRSPYRLNLFPNFIVRKDPNEPKQPSYEHSFPLLVRWNRENQTKATQFRKINI
jgi:hypothetical protein